VRATVTVLDRDPDDVVRVVDETGRVVGDVPDVDDETLVEMYRQMRLARHFDTRAVNLQRQGRMGTYPPLSGQEAAQAGSAAALRDDDWLFPSYREHLATYAAGVPLHRTLLFWMGHEAGNVSPPEANVFPAAVPIATQTLHATGVAWAKRLRGDNGAALCYFGDGATSEGDFHEACNFAGVFDAPCVFFCNNNQWAISVPRERQTASATIAGKADAYGFDGVQVDGMDPLAVYRVTEAALRKARDDDPDRPRPTLIEAVQYRFGAHTTADDPSVYRSDDEVDSWRRKDPIPRTETFLRERGLLDDDRVAAIEASVEDEVAEAIEQAESTPRPAPTEQFDHAYTNPPPALADQRDELERLHDRVGDEGFLH
jgi:pyruvate dehydrogenase E1 component alpha subunit